VCDRIVLAALLALLRPRTCGFADQGGRTGATSRWLPTRPIFRNSTDGLSGAEIFACYLWRHGCSSVRVPGDFIWSIFFHSCLQKRKRTDRSASVLQHTCEAPQLRRHPEFHTKLKKSAFALHLKHQKERADRLHERHLSRPVTGFAFSLPSYPEACGSQEHLCLHRMQLV